MKGYNLWSYAPYRPLLTEVGDIYICRVVPSENAIHFEWLKDGYEEFKIFCRKRGEGDFILSGQTSDSQWDIKGLEINTDYEFYVKSGDKSSRVRLARCGESVGTVVNYLHPEDKAYEFSGQYLCSPSLLRHPDGYLLASMDVFGHGTPQNLTLIFRSDDDGKTWHYVSELMPSFWGKMFIHNGELYMLSCSTEYGDLLIGKSTDGGRTFSAPVTLLRGSNGKDGNVGIHKNPQNIFCHNGRIYETLEWGSWGKMEEHGYCHAAMVMSCDENDDLLVPENWSFSEPKNLEADAPELEPYVKDGYTIEGTLTVDRGGKLVNIMRFGNNDRYALVYEVDTENHEAKLKYQRLMKFPANLSKFMIKYDEVSDCYYSVATRLYREDTVQTRNLLSFMKSKDLDSWEVVCDLFDYCDRDYLKYGFQYVDFYFEGDDIIYLCRTAMNEPNHYHDSNYSTFHRIEKFREI